jgi:acyl-CoA reductase-like NAD-dependent aldehyde dehydrogenase
MDKLAEALSREHGKTIPDAKGDVIRGLEVAEFCFGAPHLLKGEFTEGAGPASTCIRCASRSAWSPASRLSISRR